MEQRVLRSAPELRLRISETLRRHLLMFMAPSVLFFLNTPLLVDRRLHFTSGLLSEIHPHALTER